MHKSTLPPSLELLLLSKLGLEKMTKKLKSMDMPTGKKGHDGDMKINRQKLTQY